jgi:hypothetical protein
VGSVRPFSQLEIVFCFTPTASASHSCERPAFTLHARICSPMLILKGLAHYVLVI